MISTAIQHSATAVNAVATEAQITVPFNRLPVSAISDAVGLAGDGSPLRAVLQDASRVGPDALGEQLVRGIALRKDPVCAVARQAMRLGLGQSFTRMQTIYRTEMLRTYRQTALASYSNSNYLLDMCRSVPETLGSVLRASLPMGDSIRLITASTNIRTAAAIFIQIEKRCASADADRARVVCPAARGNAAAHTGHRATMRRGGMGGRAWMIW